MGGLFIIRYYFVQVDETGKEEEEEEREVEKNKTNNSSNAFVPLKTVRQMAYGNGNEMKLYCLHFALYNLHSAGDTIDGHRTRLLMFVAIATQRRMPYVENAASISFSRAKSIFVFLSVLSESGENITTNAKRYARLSRKPINIHNLHPHNQRSLEVQSISRETHTHRHTHVFDDCAPLCARIAHTQSNTTHTHTSTAGLCFVHRECVGSVCGLLFHTTFFFFSMVFFHFDFSLFIIYGKVYIMTSIQWLVSKREGHKKFGHPPKQCTMIFFYLFYLAH